MKTCAFLLFMLGFHFLQAQSWNQMTKVVASDRDTVRFGFSVALSGDYAFVGDYQDTRDESSLNPKTNAGSVYVYQLNDCIWTFVQKLVASDRDSFDGFGYQVSMSGNYAIVGAYQEDDSPTNTNAGAAYIFQNMGGTWMETQKLVASDRASEDNFGLSVAMDGDYAVVGAYREDEDAAGMNTLGQAGSAYIFKNTAGVWSQVQKIVPSIRAGGDNFGVSVSIDGDYIVAGAYFEDEDANEMNFLSFAGSAYIFKNTAGTWSQVQKIVNSDRASNDRFGFSVDISGDHIIAGAVGEDEDEMGMNTVNFAGSAYIFRNVAGVWTQVKKAVSSDRGPGDSMGNSVSISGDYAIVSCDRDDHDCNGMSSLTDAGSAFIYKNVAGIWSLDQKICGTDRGISDFFALRVAIEGDYVMTTCHLDDEDEQGLNTINNSGSAYFFKLGTCDPPVAVCGVVTVYVDPSSPEYDGPGTNNIWWIPSDDVDAGSMWSSQFPSIQVRRHLSQIPFDWTTNGACIDVTLNGSVNNNDKGIVYRNCLPVRNADFNVWKLYQLRVQDQWGTSTCYGTVKVVPLVPVFGEAPVVHVIYPPQVSQAKSETEYLDGLLRDAEQFDDLISSGFTDFTIYPNPGYDILQMSWEAITEESMTISITDLAGRLVSSNEYEVLSGMNHVMVDMSAQVTGVYVLHITSDSLEETKKWIKIGE